MSLSAILRLLARKWLLLLLVPLALSVSTYFFARQLPKMYASDTTIYTGIASGYSLSGNAQADYNSTNNAFDNLINLITTRSTKEEVIYQLLTAHLWATSQNQQLLSVEPYSQLREAIPADLRQQLTGATEQATLQNVRQYAQANDSNVVYRLLNSDSPVYSLKALTHLTATRIGASDLVRLEYESYNPELSRSTLALVTQVFLKKSRNLREGQTESVIAYYEAELKRAKERLEKAESENLAFNRTNNIINYDEQSKNIATEKEALASELTQVQQQYAGAQASLQAIAQRLGKREAGLLSSRQVVEQRQKLSQLNAKIADQQLFSQQQEPGNAAKVKDLQAEADRVAQNLTNSVNDYSAHNVSTEGVPSQDLLKEWVQNMVLAEANRAKLNVMTRRQQQFAREYERMAPLGATLKRIEREIELAEKEYLSTLASLNASRASEQNTQLTSKLKIIDPPNLPAAPKNNKLLLLVLLSGVGGFVFVSGLVIGLSFLDKSLKSPSVASRRIGLPVAGVMLDAHTAPQRLLEVSQQRSLDQLVRDILLRANTPPAPTPFVVGIFSVLRQEGKTTFCQALAQRCHEMGIQTLTLYPDTVTNSESDYADVPSLFYQSSTAAVQGWQLDQLIQHAIPKRVTEVGTPNVQVVLVEFPALREEALPVGVLRQINLGLLTVPASRAWSLADRHSLERLQAATTAPVEIVLSGVAAHYREEVDG